jgi:hypothetical protein
LKNKPPLCKNKCSGGDIVERYKCDACGNATCIVRPKEAWGAPSICLYDVGLPINWEIIKTKKKSKGRKKHK